LSEITNVMDCKRRNLDLRKKLSDLIEDNNVLRQNLESYYNAFAQ